MALPVAGTEMELDRSARPLRQHDADAVQFAEAGSVAAGHPDEAGVPQTLPLCIESGFREG